QRPARRANESAPTGAVDRNGRRLVVGFERKRAARLAVLALAEHVLGLGNRHQRRNAIGGSKHDGNSVVGGYARRQQRRRGPLRGNRPGARLDDAWLQDSFALFAADVEGHTGGDQLARGGGQEYVIAA